jgi:DNA-binding MurR/RpiR family transcriptional regulator
MNTIAKLTVAALATAALVSGATASRVRWTSTRPP